MEEVGSASQSGFRRVLAIDRILTNPIADARFFIFEFYSFTEAAVSCTVFLPQVRERYTKVQCGLVWPARGCRLQ